ncbi:prepilin-type N-terminal cleavage/methylation domain-containing protein [Methylobacterium sp. J-043]|nr:prepilin-type N-terminal cleavage/methylation domain-containing protein [Methylobacterium sp. J-043]
MKPDFASGGRDGFTLAEMLIVIAIVGLILSLSSGLSWTVQRLDERAHRETAARENLVSAARMFRALVAGAVPDLRTTDGLSTGGTDTELNLVSVGLPILGFDRPEPMTLKWHPERSDGALLLRWRDRRSEMLREETILQGARALSFSYFIENPDRVTAAWRSEWVGRDRLPLAVLMRIEVPGLGPSIEIIERAMGHASGGCAGLPHEEACRTGRRESHHGR